MHYAIFGIAKENGRDHKYNPRYTQAVHCKAEIWQDYNRNKFYVRLPTYALVKLCRICGACLGDNVVIWYADEKRPETWCLSHGKITEHGDIEF